MHGGFVFITDDSCDLNRDYLKENDIPTMELSYTIEGVQRKAYDLPPEEFYALLRSGKMSITAQVNVEEARDFFEPFLKAGKDIIYIAFSSGLSGTCSSAMVAARDLSEAYPERKICVIDSLAASMGQGLLVYNANELRKNGAGIDEIERFVLDNRDHVVHSVAADDLMHLHRGGRVSRTSAIAGSMLGIKPMIILNNEGKLIPIGKARGRKQALATLVTQLQERVGDTHNDIFMVSHADCAEDAKYVADMVRSRMGIDNYMINFIGPVIGSHTGPGTVALFMMGKHK